MCAAAHPNFNRQLATQFTNRMTMKLTVDTFYYMPDSAPQSQTSIAIQFTIQNDYEVDCRDISLHAQRRTAKKS